MGRELGFVPCVLVVDDNEQNRALARATLEGEGFDVVLAKNGEEGLVAFAEREPDCVLMDVRMPGIDGFQACKRLRSMPGGKSVPVIFLTAARDLDTFDSAQSAGGDDFVTKPVQPAEMIQRVQAAVKMRHLDASNQEYFEVVRRQRDALLRLQLQKERLACFVVHDLKNPVSSIDLLAQLLERDKSLSADARETASSIRVEVSALMRLILNLLDINKSEEGQLTTSPASMSLSALVAKIVDSIQVRARAREVNVVTALAGVDEISADADLLRRVLENLLDNALRHTPKGSCVTVSARRGDGQIEVSVADQGRGVPAALRESIFERFAQASLDQPPARTGRGLGLTFCRLAIEAHGGRIDVVDAEPGAKFCIRLPHGS
jgi:two-component system, sensor histidine kinase and response regulator